MSEILCETLFNYIMILFLVKMSSQSDNQKNIFDEPLKPCSMNPLTGWTRSGYCENYNADRGVHTVCAQMTKDFLNFTRTMGNDLSTPRPEYSFPGLKPGDRWCLCASRWQEAYAAGKAPSVVLDATHEVAMKFAKKDDLVKMDSQKVNDDSSNGSADKKSISNTMDVVPKD